MNTGDRASEVVRFAIARMRFLRTRERRTVAETVRSESLFSSLSLTDLAYIIGRLPELRTWDPQALLADAVADAEYCDRQDISVSCYEDEDYPPQLRTITDAPYLLFYRGELPSQDHPLVGIVGTREPSRSGYEAAYELGRDFGAAGVAVVSGLARGIDAAAHDGCIAGGAATYAVGGAGIDKVYPVSNRRLAGIILDRGGALISEYPPGTPALRYHFPERNRIISGLVRSVVVVEAPGESGALITADFALDQGREVVVHEVGLKTKQGEGIRKLVDDGAATITCAADVLADWSVVYEGLDHEAEYAGARMDNNMGTLTGQYIGVGRSHAEAAALAGFSPARAGRQLALELSQELGLGVMDE